MPATVFSGFGDEEGLLPVLSVVPRNKNSHPLLRTDRENGLFLFGREVSAHRNIGSDRSKLGILAYCGDRQNKKQDPRGCLYHGFASFSSPVRGWWTWCCCQIARFSRPCAGREGRRGCTMECCRPHRGPRRNRVYTRRRPR